MGWLAAALLMVGAITQVQAQTRVRSTAELTEALRGARAGQVIELAPGQYGRLEIVGRRGRPVSFTQPIVIRSADAARPAELASIELRFVENITFDNLDLRYRYASADTMRTKPFTVRESSGVTFSRSRFIGDVATGTGTPADGFGTGIGLEVVASSGVTLEDSRFETWHRGAVFAQSRNLIVRGNEIRDLRSDGFNFAEVSNVVIERNRFLGFRTSLTTGDHPDMIQFWTNKTKSPSTDVAIRDNYIDIGDGPWTQSIFMRNEEVDNGRAGQEMFYRNITITGNFIRNSHLHGITVGETQGLVIANNTLIQAAESPRVMHVTVPGINIKPTSQNVRIENNIAPRYPEIQAGWTFQNNIKVQRNFPRAPDFYNLFFVDALAPGSAPAASFQVLPGAAAARNGAGSELNRFDERPRTPRLVIATAALAAGRGGEQKLEVTGAYGPSGKLDLSGASTVWKLDQDVVKTGLSVTHRFAKPGMQRAIVTVTLKNGAKIEGGRWLMTE